MPLYEYRCQSCGRQFELLVRASTVPACPDCASLELDKQFSVFAVGAGGAAASAQSLPPSCQGCAQPGAPGCSLN
jgi:putative FmdB family regulatory protein